MKNDIPEGFVYLTDIVPDIIQDIRYYSTYNFVGTRVDGYEAPVAICTLEAAEALKKVSDQMLKQGYILRVFDTYRPQRSVHHLVRWAEDPEDTKNKDVFYPDLEKESIINDGYINPISGHSRGSIIDLTLVDRVTGKELDMGTAFDYFGTKSHHGTGLITKEQTKNREILKDVMVEQGFEPLPQEWWHYSLKDEPYPDTYFDFVIK